MAETKINHKPQVRSRMINKRTGEETILIDKKDIDGLKAKVTELQNQLNGAHAFMRAQEVEIESLGERIYEYESNIGCKVILQITKFFKKCIQYIKNKTMARKYSFLQ